MKIYRHYTTTPLWHIHQTARTDFSLTRDMLPGAPVTLLTQYIDRRWFSKFVYLGRRSLLSKVYVSFVPPQRLLLSNCLSLREGWYYVRVHLELFAAFQRLGLISSRQLLPSWRYFIPFTDESPIPSPPPVEDISPSSIMTWLGGVVVSATPFLLWVITQQLVADWRPQIWRQLLEMLPSPIILPKPASHLPPPPSPPSFDDDIPSPQPEAPDRTDNEREEVQEGNPGVEAENDEADEDIVTSPEVETIPEQETEPVRRSSAPSVADGGEDFDSDDDEHEVVSATLISFDVEATEATDVPQGLWSAELRPSVGPEVKPLGPLPSLYFSTMLTRLPSLMAAKILNDAILRILIAPYEAMSLRLAARVFRLRHGLPVADILGVQPFSGLCLTWFVNFVGAEFLHLSICGEIWTMSSSLARYFHMSEEQWLESGGYEWKDIVGSFACPEALY